MGLWDMAIGYMFLHVPTCFPPKGCVDRQGAKSGEVRVMGKIWERRRGKDEGKKGVGGLDWEEG